MVVNCIGIYMRKEGTDIAKQAYSGMIVTIE